MIKWRSLVRPVICFLVGLFFLLKTDTLLWFGFFILALFFFFVDVLSFGRLPAENSNVPENFTGPYGVLGEYIVDATDSYGLFIKLRGWSIFVDIKADEFLEQREQWALFLYMNQKKLEENLVNFLDDNPTYKTKNISYIGLHSKNLEQGEIFWNHSGYTLLKGLNFVLE